MHKCPQTADELMRVQRYLRGYYPHKGLLQEPNLIELILPGAREETDAEFRQRIERGIVTTPNVSFLAPEDWPHGPPDHHETCCLLHQGAHHCDCKASDASDTEWGIHG